MLKVIDIEIFDYCFDEIYYTKAQVKHLSNPVLIFNLY